MSFFWESDYESVFNVLEFIFKRQIRFKTYVYQFVGNLMGYPNM